MIVCLFVYILMKYILIIKLTCWDITEQFFTSSCEAEISPFSASVIWWRVWKSGGGNPLSSRGNLHLSQPLFTHPLCLPASRSLTHPLRLWQRCPSGRDAGWAIRDDGCDLRSDGAKLPWGACGSCTGAESRAWILPAQAQSHDRDSGSELGAQPAVLPGLHRPPGLPQGPDCDMVRLSKLDFYGVRL